MPDQKNCLENRFNLDLDVMEQGENTQEVEVFLLRFPFMR